LDAEASFSLGGASVAVVISDRQGAYGLVRAEGAGKPAILEIPDLRLPKEDRQLDLSNRILAQCRKAGVELIVLAGFLSILRGPILGVYENRIINIHPSLLPKYGGAGMYGDRVHRAVLDSGDKESGCTVHLVDRGTDTGPILLQRRVPVLSGDTVESLANRIHTKEHRALVQGVVMMAEEMVR
jgi:phosphoribosylglycinamide formyltransferase-1